MITKAKKRMLLLEETDFGVRLTVPGEPYLIKTGSVETRNLSTHEIYESWLSDFTPGNQPRAQYAAKHCTDTGFLHPPEGCDGICHDLNCSAPADSFEHHKAPDGRELCMPYCKSHANTMAHYVGRAALFALDFGIVEDLRSEIRRTSARWISPLRSPLPCL